MVSSCAEDVAVVHRQSSRFWQFGVQAVWGSGIFRIGALSFLGSTRCSRKWTCIRYEKHETSRSLGTLGKKPDHLRVYVRHEGSVPRMLKARVNDSE